MKNNAYLPVKQKQVSLLVFEQLRDSIFRGQLKPGEQLLPERDLASTMQVSRTSIRNAIIQLITLGHLETRQGKGTFVVDRDVSASTNPFASIISPGKSTVDELLEFRVGLGLHGSTLAAERATVSDITFMEETLAREDGCIVHAGSETEADIAFHMGIAYATHNSVYVDLTKRFYEYMFFRIKELHSVLYEVEENLQELEAQHYVILNAIKAHNPKLAREGMRTHIQFLRDVFYKHSNA
ncbi:MAG: GntR family transcriptional regulator [Desulfotalea sp.]|nr:MAG: GntR family transcriptional regulator [Desulfotalea sp.]